MAVPEETVSANKVGPAVDFNGRPGRGPARLRRKPPLEAEIGSAGQKAPKKCNGDANDHTSGALTAPPALPAEARMQLAALKESETRLKTELSLVAKKHEASESALRALGEELGNALADRSAAELDAERLAADRDLARDKAAELDRVLAQRLREWNTEREEQGRAREQLAQALSTTAMELEKLCAERDNQIRVRQELDQALSNGRAEQDRLREEAEELRRLLERESARWHAECAALAGERDQLADKIGEIRDERDRLQAKLHEATEQVVRFETQAAWADEQLAFLAEKETGTAAELKRRLSDIETLNIRVDGLRTEIASIEDDRRRRDNFQAELRMGVGRLVGYELPAKIKIPEILDTVRRRIRKLERQLDQETVERERLFARLKRRERAWYSAMLLFCSTLLSRRIGYK